MKESNSVDKFNIKGFCGTVIFAIAKEAPDTSPTTQPTPPKITSSNLNQESNKEASSNKTLSSMAKLPAPVTPTTTASAPSLSLTKVAKPLMQPEALNKIPLHFPDKLAREIIKIARDPINPLPFVGDEQDAKMINPNTKTTSSTTSTEKH